MSQITSNSALGNKSLSILIFILVFLNVSKLTSGTPTDFSTVLTTAQDLVQPQKSSWGFIGEIVSYSVEAVQNTLKYLIGIEKNPPRPREFYIVHIKDEKNPNNDKVVWRERGNEDKGDIPVNGGKLPENSLVVNERDPVTEYVPSSGPSPPAAKANSPSTPTTNDKNSENIQVVGESTPPNRRGSSKKNTNAGEDEENIADVSGKESPSPPAGTQTMPPKSKSKEDEPTPDRRLEPVIQLEKPKLAKSANPPSQSDYSNYSPGEDSFQSAPGKFETSSSNQQMSPAPSTVMSPIEKDGLPAQNQVQNVDTLNGSSPALQQNTLGSQNIGAVSPSVENLIPLQLDKEAHPSEHKNLPSSSENYSTNAADKEILPPQMPSAPIYSDPDHHRSFGGAESDLRGILKPLSTQPPVTKPAPEMDESSQIPKPSLKQPLATEPIFEVEEFPQKQDDFEVEEFPQKQDDFEVDEFPQKQDDKVEPVSDDDQNLTPSSLPMKEAHQSIPNEEESHIAQPVDHESATPESENVHNPDESSESPAFDPNEIISMNECELEFERHLWETERERCEQFQSAEEFIEYVKNNSNCSTDDSSQMPDESSNNEGYNPEELIAMNECEIEYEKYLWENYPDFCKQFQSKEEFIATVKENSGCSPSGEAEYGADDMGQDAADGSNDQEYAPQDSTGEEVDTAEEAFLEHHPPNSEFDGNFYDHSNGNDNDNDTSSSSEFEPDAKPIKTEKNGSKKKMTSTKEKKKQKKILNFALQ